MLTIMTQAIQNRQAMVRIHQEWREDYMGSQVTERTVALDDKEGRSRKRGRRGKGGRGTRGGRKTRTTPRRIPSCCMHVIPPVSTCCLYFNSDQKIKKTINVVQSYNSQTL